MMAVPPRKGTSYGGDFGPHKSKNVDLIEVFKKRDSFGFSFCKKRLRFGPPLLVFAYGKEPAVSL